MQIRITAAVLPYGNVQWVRGEVATVPDELGTEFIARKEAVRVPDAEYATLRKPAEHAVLPRPTSKPKPPAKGKR